MAYHFAPTEIKVVTWASERVVNQKNFVLCTKHKSLGIVGMAYRS